MALWKKDSGCYKTSYRRTREKWHYAKPYESGSFHFLFIGSSFLESSYHDVRKHNQHVEWSIWRRANAHGTESWLSAKWPTANPIHAHEQSGKVNHTVPSFLQCGESGRASWKVYFWRERSYVQMPLEERLLTVMTYLLVTIF